jgi:Carboxypeptidase regulatory-like domain/TonB dependent receptor-like, beta-barrel
VPDRYRLARITRTAALILLAWSAPALAATLQGRVRDAQGDAIAGARLRVQDPSRARSRETTTDAAGRFTVPQLPPGTYVVTVDKEGFAPRILDGVVVAVGQSQRLDLSLDLAGVSESIEALAQAPTLATVGSSTVDGVIDQTAIERLPLNGRNFLELAFLVPGNVPTPNFDPTKTNSVVVSSAGQLGRGGMITIDGAENNDDVVGGPLQNLPQDAVQEFQIATNRFTAEDGRSGASVINVLTRSGTDTLAGSLSMYARDESLQALPATYDRSLDPLPFDRQQYAAAAGGPIEKGVVHWFGALEYRDQSGALLVGERDVAQRTIRRTFAAAPLEDLLGLARLDWRASESDAFTLRAAFEDADDTAASTLDRSIGSASQRQSSTNAYQSLLARWSSTISPTKLNQVSLSYSRYRNEIVPVAPGTPQLTFPSIQDGASFRVPQATDQDRIELQERFSLVRGNHSLALGAEVQQVYGSFDLGVFQAGRIELVEDFSSFDHNGDGTIDDNDLLFAVTLRSGLPDQDLVLDDCDNAHVALYVQDDWWISDRVTLNLGLRWEVDTDVKNLSGYSDTNPLVADFYHGDRKRDYDNFGPRVGVNYAAPSGRFSLHGGWGIYYDRITLEIASLEKGLDGRALPIEVRAGNLFFLDPETGQVPPFAPSIDDPFTGFILPGAGASGINIIDNAMETPEVQQFDVGAEVDLHHGLSLRADALYDDGTNFIIGRPVGTVFNPVVGGPDRVVNLESSVGTRYRGLLASLERRGIRHRFLASYTLSKAENYANDDQIPFSSGPIDPDDLEREFGPSPNDRRHRLTFAGSFELPWGLRAAPVLTLSSGVPMDILMPDGSMRVPTLGRNAGGRRFHTGSELNDYLRNLNAAGGIDGVLLPLVRDDARFSDDFSSLDVRLSKVFSLGSGDTLEAIVEVFNVFNTTNILGVSTRNYSGYSNVLARDSEDPSDPGYLMSSSFGTPVTTAGGVFGSGGPRAVQLGVKYSF